MGSFGFDPNNQMNQYINSLVQSDAQVSDPESDTTNAAGAPPTATTLSSSSVAGPSTSPTAGQPDTFVQSSSANSLNTPSNFGTPPLPNESTPPASSAGPGIVASSLTNVANSQPIDLANMSRAALVEKLQATKDDLTTQNNSADADALNVQDQFKQDEAKQTNEEEKRRQAEADAKKCTIMKVLNAIAAPFEDIGKMIANPKDSPIEMFCKDLFTGNFSQMGSDLADSFKSEFNDTMGMIEDLPAIKGAMGGYDDQSDPAADVPIETNVNTVGMDPQQRAADRKLKKQKATQDQSEIAAIQQALGIVGAGGQALDSAASASAASGGGKVGNMTAIQG